MTDKIIKEEIAEVIEKLASQPVDEPVLHFEYPDNPDDMSFEHFKDWVAQMEGYFCGFAKRYEKQERGGVCCVDRAYEKYIIPEAKKMYEFITQSK